MCIRNVLDPGSRSPVLRLRLVLEAPLDLDLSQNQQGVSIVHINVRRIPRLLPSTLIQLIRRIAMQTDADSAYSSYRPDYRAQDRCASAVLSPSPDWIYPNYTVSPQALPSQSGRVQLPSMYTTQRHPDQSYPSPSPSVPSPGPRSMSDSLDYPSQQGSSTPPGAEYPPARESQVGLARQPGARQMSLEYKDHGRRHSGDSQLGEVRANPLFPVNQSFMMIF